MRIRENLASVKRITFSLIIVLFVISLSVPVYAPARRPDYIEWMPVVSVGDLELEYDNIDVVGRRVIEDQPSGIIAILIDLVCDGNGTFTEVDTEDTYALNFIQQMTLKILLSDGSVQLEDTVSLSGSSNLTLETSPSRITFKCVVYGSATWDSGEVLLQLSLVGNSPLGPIISLQIHGIFSQPVDPELSMTAEGQILARLGGR